MNVLYMEVLLPVLVMFQTCLKMARQKRKKRERSMKPGRRKKKRRRKRREVRSLRKR